jgi:N-acetylmuramoyl-L-alanine amidase
MPSILVEAGFISNKEEELYMNSGQGQDEIVTDMVNAIKAYLGSTETPRSGDKEAPVIEVKSVALYLNDRNLFRMIS